MSQKEWKIHNALNPFNTYKILKHVDYWKSILDKEIPPPIAVTIDPTNICDLNCLGCNASKVIHDDANVEMMDARWMMQLPAFLKDWGVKAVTIAGGGEPLLHKMIDEFIDECRILDLPCGIITNGTRIHKHVEALSLLKWVGVSVDAGSAEVYEKVRRPNSKDVWNKLVDNIAMMCEQNVEVTYKFLINRDNIKDIITAVGLAKELGCNQIHLRPIGTPWYEENRPIFIAREVNEAMGQVEEARKQFEEDDFKVFGVTHKFGDNWRVDNAFSKCYATYMYLVIEPGGRLSTCCDNRGNPDMVLADGLRRPVEILDYWGSTRHHKMFDDIDVNKCPRCTFTLHNQIFEHCIMDDTMYCDFI